MMRDHQQEGYSVTRVGDEPGQAKRLQAPSLSGGESSKPDWGWTRSWQTNKSGPLPNLFNAMIALRQNDVLRGVFVQDDMQQRILLLKPLPTMAVGPQSADFTVRPVGDNDISQLQEYLQSIGLRTISKDATHQAIRQLAAEHAVHPVRTYLEGLKWDGHPRVPTFLHTYFGASPGEYESTVGTMFLVSMVARILRPGCKVDHMLVLEGEQGALKSTACAVLGDKWYSDNLPDITSGKDVQQHLAGKWLIEISELSALGRAEENALKSFISRQVEQYRPPYARCEIFEPRQCVFIGTTNLAVYLRDETGGRRFWPARVGHIDIEALRRDRDQILAEAARLFEQGTQWWPTREFERDHAKFHQESRFEADAWEQPISAWLADKSDVTLLEVATGALLIERAAVNRPTQLRISSVLKRLGWASENRVVQGRRPWSPPRSPASSADTYERAKATSLAPGETAEASGAFARGEIRYGHSGPEAIPTGPDALDDLIPF